MLGNGALEADIEACHVRIFSKQQCSTERMSIAHGKVARIGQFHNRVVVVVQVVIKGVKIKPTRLVRSLTRVVGIIILSIHIAAAGTGYSVAIAGVDAQAL